MRILTCQTCGQDVERYFKRGLCCRCYDRTQAAKKLERRKTRRVEISMRGSSDRKKLKLQVFAAYGNKCVCCGETAEPFLTIDHEKRDGKEHRKVVGAAGLYRWLKKNNFPKEGFRLLCMNCNFAIRFGDPCPHQTRMFVPDDSLSTAIRIL